MIILILTNVWLGVVFKLYDRFGVDNLAAIVINYFTCVVVAAFLKWSNPIPLDIIDRPWFWFAVFLGLVFIVAFQVVAKTFQEFGVSFTSIIQKMSLIFPTAYAIALYGESLHFWKAVGLILAILAIVLVNFPDKKDPDLTKKIMSPLLLLPITTLLFSGVIEIILYYVQVEGFFHNDNIDFVTAIFGFAAVFGLILLILQMPKRTFFIRTKDIMGGLALGIPNYFTVYLLMYLLGKGWEGSVLFPVNNVGILALSAIVGVSFFGEKFNVPRILGLLSAILGIYLIAS